MGWVVEWRWQKMESLNWEQFNKFTQSDKQEKETGGRKGICGTVSKDTGIDTIRIPEGDEKDCGAKQIFKEMMAENFHLVKDKTYRVKS